MDGLLVLCCGDPHAYIEVEDAPVASAYHQRNARLAPIEERPDISYASSQASDRSSPVPSRNASRNGRDQFVHEEVKDMLLGKDYQQNESQVRRLCVHKMCLRILRVVARKSRRWRQAQCHLLEPLAEMTEMKKTLIFVYEVSWLKGVQVTCLLWLFDSWRPTSKACCHLSHQARTFKWFA